TKVSHGAIGSRGTSWISPTRDVRDSHATQQNLRGKSAEDEALSSVQLILKSPFKHHIGRSPARSSCVPKAMRSAAHPPFRPTLCEGSVTP
ncbi:hypothetical protein, partial [Caballeronia arvi]|uniref:hypothetical protein n=1 Tax=Caballeronia arvi TaxID=1777135 RepID=UPI001F357945